MDKAEAKRARAKRVLRIRVPFSNWCEVRVRSLFGGVK